MSTEKPQTFMIINEQTRQHVMSKLDNTGPYEVTIKKITEDKVRTNKQNASIHVYCDMLAQEYIGKDLDMAVVLAAQLSRPWTGDAVKEYQWRPLQIAHGFNKSTTKLTTTQVSEVYTPLNKHTYNRFDINIEFPSQESMMMKAVYGVK